MLPDDLSHYRVKLIRGSSRRVISLIPFAVKRTWFELLPLQRVDVAREPCGLFAAEMLLEVRYQVEGTKIVFCAAWPIHFLVVRVSIPSSMSCQIELSPMLFQIR